MGKERSRCWLSALLTPWFLVSLGAVNAPVADAAARVDLEEVRQLLRHGADVNAAQGDGMTALHWAAQRGHHKLGEILIYAGANVAARTRIGHYTPLHLAARGGRVGMVKLLLRVGSDPNAATTNSGAMPIHLAAASGNPEIAALLIESGADVNALEASWGQTPLIFAASRGRPETIKVLLAAGADPALTSRPVNVVEREAADRAAQKRLSEFLAAFKEKEGGGLDWRPTPSQVQAAIEVAREIQRKWPNVPRPGGDKKKPDQSTSGKEPGGEATKAEAKMETAEQAQDPGAQADSTMVAETTRQPGEEKGTAQVAGPDEKPPDSTSAPVRYNAEGEPVGAEPPAGTSAPLEPSPSTTGPVKYNAEGEPVDDQISDAADDQQPRPLSYGQLVESWGGLTPLLHAVRQGHLKATLALLDGGADVNQPSAGDQTTPLLMAAINGQFDLALILLERGADPNLASTAGTTPLFSVLERQWAPRASYAHPTEHHQQQATHLEVLEALLRAGADPNVRLKRHLWYMEYTFAVLRRAGINLKGATPFWRAAQALDVDAMRLLKAHGADLHIATVKPPQRRRRRPTPTEAQQAAAKKKTLDKQAATSKGEEATAAPDDQPQTSTPERATPDESPPPKAKAESEGETVGLENREEKEKDHSGLPPVPLGGPFIYPLHAAAGAGYGQYFAANAHRFVPGNWLKAVKFLVEECGAEVDLRDANGYTALHHAASRGDNEVVLYLVEKGADVTVVSRKGQTTADMANGPIERVPPYPSTIELLVKLGAKNNNKCLSC